MSVENDSPTRFAYGWNEYNGCVCPAVAAGFDPAGEGEGDYVPGLTEAAESYDQIVRQGHGGNSGTVSEEEAKDAWIQMLEWANDDNLSCQTAAEQVAIYHDWVEPEDTQ